MIVRIYRIHVCVLMYVLCVNLHMFLTGISRGTPENSPLLPTCRINSPRKEEKYGHRQRLVAMMEYLSVLGVVVPRW